MSVAMWVGVMDSAVSGEVGGSHLTEAYAMAASPALRFLRLARTVRALDAEVRIATVRTKTCISK